MGASWIRLHPVRVTYGEPIDFTAEAQRSSGKEFYQYISRTVMARIAALGQVAPPTDPSEGTERADWSERHPAAKPYNAE